MSDIRIIDKLMTVDYWRICIANFLLYASVYLILPIFPFTLASKLDIPISDMGFQFLIYAMGMILVGPFHAYLGDEFKRKNVLIDSIFAISLALLGLLFVNDKLQLSVVVLVLGMAFGLATTAGITIAIDITTSPFRNKGNKVFTFCGYLGMFISAGLSVLLFKSFGFETLTYIAISINVLCMLLISGIYIAFRAPNNLSYMNLDRFLLLSAWAPSINLFLVSIIPGLFMPLFMENDILSYISLAVLTFAIIPVINHFVVLSHHCQRATANTTCTLASQTGLLVGLFISYRITKIYPIALSLLIVSILLFFFLTIPHIKKNKIRSEKF